MNAFINGEADAYAKRNAGHNPVEPWFTGLLETIDFRTLIDMGGGDGARASEVLYRLPGVSWTISVDARAGESYVGDGLQMVYGQDVETYDIPICDLVMFNYVLHWLPSAEQVLERAMKVSKYILINDFAPPYAIDVPYAHCEGVVTRKRRYGMYCAEAGWVRHIAVKYRYHNEPDGETCCAEIWRKP